MRPSILASLLFLGTSTTAIADSTTGSGGGGGGGRLSQVSAGIGNASGSGSSSGASAGTSYYDDDYHDCNHTSYWRDERCAEVAAAHGVVVPVTKPRPRSIARFAGYAGAQKVYESDGSVSLELGVVDRHFRLDAGLTHYFEGRMDGGQLTMTMPTLTAGFRIDEAAGGNWIELGVVNARTNGDPMGDSSIYGPLVRARLEHAAGRTTLFGAAEAMFFKHDIRAYGGRAGVRIGRVQASLRILDFNVGPALYGPEVGVVF
jgi:hypothetical protein